MSEEFPFEAFERRSDYTDWNRYVEQIDSIDLQAADRDRARRALSYLQNLLGDDFLKKAAEEGNLILGEFFLNAAPRARLACTAFAERLKALEDADGFNDLVARIRHQGRVGEALTVLDVASRFHGAGFAVSFDPVVNVAGKDGLLRPKTPDLKLVNLDTTEELFVEVSRLRWNRQQEMSNRAFSAVWRMAQWVMSRTLVEDSTQHQNMLPYIRIKVVLDEDEMPGILAGTFELIKSLVLEVEATGEFREFSNDVIEIGISPPHDHSRGTEWAAERNLNDVVEGPLVPLNEIARARGKIREKLQQVPNDQPGILVITTDENFLFLTYGLEEIIGEIEEEVCRHPRLYAVVLTHSSFSGQQPPVAAELGDHMYTRVTTETVTTEQAVVIRNPAFGLDLSVPSANKICRSFGAAPDWVEKTDYKHVVCLEVAIRNSPQPEALYSNNRPGHRTP